MDPQATWNDLLDACEQGDRETAAEAARALCEWLDRDGFPPQTQPGRTLDDALNRVIAKAVCRHAIAQANDC